MDKLRIVESLKRRGEFVAVTGDGVNDAPAIRSANIGVSMGSGTDTAKETSSMIIIDDNFKSIVSGIELGRCAYSNIRKVCFFLLSCGLAEVLFYLLSIVFNLPMPLVAIQLLWLNLVTDGFQDIALSFEKVEKGIMKRKPISPNESIFNKQLLSEVLFCGLLIGVIVFAIWFILIERLNMEITLARGYVMALMVFIQNIHVFNCRSETESAFNISISSNPLIILTIFGSILLQVIVMEVPVLSKFLKTSPIPYSHMFILLFFALTILIAMELYKQIKYKKITK
jgi:magnesium-transporting ATPase (P-type)